METKGIKSIPYGISDYERATLENRYYVDKTRFIPLIEEAASFFFLIRPRRFGKTLLINMLAAYYDINNKERFEELFGERWIFNHETSLRAKFMILRFNFSAVDSHPDRLEQSFEDYCTGCIIDFIDRYEHFFTPGFRQEVMQATTTATRITHINNKASLLGQKIYLFIDEYDNFTNTILSTLRTEAYRKATHGEGFFRYFFNVLKMMTSANGMALERMFITGVSPITLDDVTSGFNIGMNFTTDPMFNNLVGFSETELREMLTYFKETGAIEQDIEEIIADMKPWYDNYCFAAKSLKESMYNSDMVLYYLNSLVRIGEKPEEMIDKNIRTDYNKLRHLVRIDHKLEHNFSVLREIIETGQTVARLNSSFSVLDMVKPDNFKSLLYYFGLVSIAGTQLDNVRLRIPNHVVREQLYSYLIETYEQSDIFTIDFSHLRQLMVNMAIDGQWQPVFQYIATELERQSRIREFIDGEAHVKGFLLAYLGMTSYYYLTPEYELKKGYADFYFRPTPLMLGIEYGYLLEVKYMKRSDPDSRLYELKQEAREQLLRYATDSIVTETIGQAKLKLITVVFKGWELTDMEEVN